MLFEQRRTKAESQIQEKPDPTKISWAIVSFLSIFGYIILNIALILYVYFECTKQKTPNYVTAPTNVRMYHNDNLQHGDEYCLPGRALSNSQYAFIALYSILRFFYSLIFTFTVFFAVLMMFLQKDFSRLGSLSDFQEQSYNKTKLLAYNINMYGQQEMLRQAKIVTNMQGACSHYIEELFNIMHTQMDNVTANQHRLAMYGDDSSISYLMKERMKRRMNIFDEDVDDYFDHYHSIFYNHTNPIMKSYKRYLKGLHSNGWLQFPQVLFNRSDFSEMRKRMFRVGELSGNEVDFANFMSVEEVEDVQLWPYQFWERYHNTLPPSPELPVPSADITRPSCDLDPQYNLLNMSASSVKGHLDSSRFLSKLHTSPGSTETMDQEYMYLSKEEWLNTQDLLFSVREFVKEIDTDLLRIVFMVLDVIIVIYRCSSTYITASMLCRGFEESVNLKHVHKPPSSGGSGAPKPADYHNYHVNQSSNSDRTSESMRLRDSKEMLDTPISEYTATLDSQKSILQNRSNGPVDTMQSMVRNDTSFKHNDSSSVHWQRKKWDVCQLYTGKLLQSDLVPKIIIAIVLLVLFYIIVATTGTLLTTDMISEIGGFESFFIGLATQLNQTNEYLTKQAHYFNEVSMKIYQSQMKSELLNLQSMLEYFNAEQKRLVANYIKEACAIKKDLLGNWSCDIEVVPMTLSIPVLPCNFIPLQPQPYEDFSEEAFKAQLGQGFEPYFAATRNVVLKTGYAILIVVIIMLILHVIGVVLFHFLKTRHKFPVHKVYVTTTPSMATVRTKPPNKDSDSESEGEEGFKSYPTHVRMSPEKNYARTETLLTDFKYSETKV